MPPPARIALTTRTARRPRTGRPPGRAVLHGGVAAVLVLAAVACGDDGSSTVGSADPGATTPAPSSTTTTSGSATTEPGSSDGPGQETPTPEPGSRDASMVAVVDAYIAAVAGGDLEAAWALLDERSQSALGGFDAFEELRSGLSEGIGAWSAAEGRTSHVIRLDPEAAVVLLRGTVPLEGPPAPGAQAVLVRGTGDEARVSPFEETLAGPRSIDVDPPPPTEVLPAATVRVTVPTGWR